MNVYEPLMFHKTYPFDFFLEESKMMEKQKELMYSYFPNDYQEMQKKAEVACDKLEYPGSRMYDEHPDKEKIRQLANSLLEPSWREKNYEDVMFCLLCNEIFLRRCRTWKSRKYIR